MAVFTPLTRQQINDLVTNYDIGALVSFDGIVQGVDNTNYKIETSRGRFVLTIFESRINPDEIPYFIALMEFLSRSGITCPAPVQKKTDPSAPDDAFLSFVCGKPAAFFTFLEGRSIESNDITPALCGELGNLLARLHLAGQKFAGQRKNSMSFEAWRTRLERVGNPAVDALKELQEIRNLWPTDLPQGSIHADLFPDNVFIKDGHIFGVIDFYFSATDFLAYDLAIVANAWCFDGDRWDTERWNSLIHHYEAIRPLTPQEKSSFQILCRGAALRFYSSRLHDLTFHDPNHLVHPKSPEEYLTKLEFHRHETIF